MTTIAEALSAALEHHRAGRLPEAESIYRQVLSADSNQPQAWHLLGLLAHHAGQQEIARQYIERAIALFGNDGYFHNNLGEVYRVLGKLPRATECYRRAVELLSHDALPWNNLGNVLVDQQRSEEAIVCYRRALELQADHADAHGNLGTALHQLGRLDEAINCYRRAIELKPDSASAHNNLGAALKAQGRLPEAVACYEQALRLVPNTPETHNNLGIVRFEQGEWQAAMDCYSQALRLRSHYFEALNNLGALWQELGESSKARDCFQQAVAIHPEFIEAHHNLGNAWHELAQTPEAIQSYRRAIELKPGHLPAIVALIAELQGCCAWQELPALQTCVTNAFASEEALAAERQISPFSFLSLPIHTTPLQQWRCACLWHTRKFAGIEQAGRLLNLHIGRETNPERPLNVGYLSADFCSHPIGYLIPELLERHDRERVAVIAYSYGLDDQSAIRGRLMRAVDRFVDLRHSTSLVAARQIARDQVDILVDLTGYTRLARTEILAYRPAPIQVNYLGYPGTMGASFMDYILVDDYVVPADQQPYFSERLVHLPGCYQVNDSRREIAPHTPTRAECGLPEKGLVYCCFNNSYKITAEVFAVWMSILRKTPGSVLWLLEGNRWVVENLRNETQIAGVNPERLVFAPKVPLSEHLARLRNADLFLDTIPYNAHVTASDALWAGCPVLTISGDTFASRVGGSLLRTLGLPELITNSLAEYEALALRLAHDQNLLGELRSRLASQRTVSRLFDATRFARSLEQAYRAMWQLYVSGQAPRGFAVNEAIEVVFEPIFPTASVNN